MNLMDRYWINQPSKLQSCHNLNGRLVIAPKVIKEKFVDVYFANGAEISARIPALALSRGWPQHLNK